MRRLLLLLAACAVGAYHLIRTARQLSSLDADDMYDVWGDDDTDPDTAYLEPDRNRHDYTGGAR